MWGEPKKGNEINKWKRYKLSSHFYISLSFFPYSFSCTYSSKWHYNIHHHYRCNNWSHPINQCLHLQHSLLLSSHTQMQPLVTFIQMIPLQLISLNWQNYYSMLYQTRKRLAIHSSQTRPRRHLLLLHPPVHPSRPIPLLLPSLLPDRLWFSTTDLHPA